MTFLIFNQKTNSSHIHSDVSDASNAQSTVKSASDKLAQAADSEITSPVVPLENGSA